MPNQFVVEYPNLRPSLWAQNRHIQTLASFFLKGHDSIRIPEKRIVHLRDGDRLVIHDDTSKSWITGDRIAIMVHGLCGSHDSQYMKRIAIRLRRHGVRTIRVDMRGFGDSTLISTGHFHAGRSDDLHDVVEFVQHLSPLSKISLVGFSLGANVVLKAAAEVANHSNSPVDSAIAVAPPIDLEFCSSNLREFGNRLYEHYFASRLTKRLSYRRRHVENLVDNGLAPLPNRLVHFDDQFVAPVNQFDGAKDYYSRCSTIDKLAHFATPTIVVAAEDDPVIPFEMFAPRIFSSSVELVHTKHGGHLGFIGNQPKDPDPYWLDWRICKWINSLDENEF